MPVLLAVWEAEAGGSWVWGQYGEHNILTKGKAKNVIIPNVEIKMTHIWSYNHKVIFLLFIFSYFALNKKVRYQLPCNPIVLE
jgi:hypothetical protein